MISAADYCSKICGAKCCYARPLNIRCPNLSSENLCLIYQTRFGQGSAEEEVVAFHILDDDSVAPIRCSRIEKLLKEPDFPEEIRAQCCFANPKLLEDF